MARQHRPDTWKLLAAALIAVASGTAFVWKVIQQPEKAALLEFTALYIAAPLALSLIMLFSYLQRR